jgi:hypothetical protein
MFIVFEDRPSDSPFVERVWTSYSERAGDFLSVASPLWEMVVTRLRGQTFMTVRGPETRASIAECPADGEWVGIRFKFGAFLPHLLPGTMGDRQDVTLAGACTRSFWLNGSTWDFPNFENAETFVARLVRNGLLSRDEPFQLSRRSVQRHVRRATGITHAAFCSIERARHATTLLREGLPILDVVQRTGYFDQPHLSRSLSRLIGQAPAQIARGERQLSFLYKTSAD